MERQPKPPMVDAMVIATVFDISKATVYNLAKRESGLPFPSYKFGRTLRFKRVDVEQFVGGPIDQFEETGHDDADVRDDA